MSSIVVAVADLLFQSRVVEGLRTLGVTPLVADEQRSAVTALASVDGVVVDLQAAGIDAPALIREAKAAGIGVLAFGKHTDSAGLRAAREAGADAVVVRSTLAEELEPLLRGLIVVEDPVADR